MKPETLAETLRKLKEKRETKDVAQREYLDAFNCVPDDLRPIWMQDAYLRGYDDAKAEAAHTEMLLREAQDEIANAKARVRELEAQIAANDRDMEQWRTVRELWERDRSRSSGPPWEALSERQQWAIRAQYVRGVWP